MMAKPHLLARPVMYTRIRAGRHGSVENLIVLRAARNQPHSGNGIHLFGNGFQKLNVTMKAMWTSGMLCGLYWGGSFSRVLA